MKFNYYPETDSLYIDLSSPTSVRSEEVSGEIVLDYDGQNRLVGIDIDNASHKVDLNDFSVSTLPFPKPAIAD